jgi:hypothetical protein
MHRIFDKLAESLSSTWTLLSDTTNFLSRVHLLESYEEDIRTLRTRLSAARKDSLAIHQIRDEIVAMRKALRLQGYDLRLGSKDIALEGFRHDDAMAEGFRRIVLGIAEADIYYLAGDVNHIELAQQLEAQCSTRRRCTPYMPHFLWYRWRNNVLVLSGAASETADSFEELKAYFAKNKDYLLKKLTSL